MIASVSAWIKDIIFIVLFASFMELLLPSSSMQRFIRVIMGLCIMLTILNPALNIIQNHLASGQELSLVSTTLNSSANIGNVTTSMVNERDKLSYELYKKELAKQIRAIVTTIDGVADARVTVAVNNAASGDTAGSIKDITVYVQPGIAAMGRNIASVPRVNLGDSDQASAVKELRPQLVAKIKHAVAELYQLSQNQIDVKLLY
ncbi:hypothetical protein SDC9_30308 [bioreactor metagenome]|uniref:Stage III sporulation protein AF n=1 Tax=bioreactor metagenome TaxID=1076179 RepID=A0A644V0A5_9ZZZZ|nr:stage III sporulation protein AF [Negativicutes bacterium]